MTKFDIKRIYEKPSSDGYRVLIDRLWPRGISKEKAQINDWCKEVAPSTELRKWFNHDETKFVEFKRRYIKELNESNEASKFVNEMNSHKHVTLLYSAKDTKHNQAVILKTWLNMHDK